MSVKGLLDSLALLGIHLSGVDITAQCRCTWHTMMSLDSQYKLYYGIILCENIIFLCT